MTRQGVGWTTPPREVETQLGCPELSASMAPFERSNRWVCWGTALKLFEWRPDVSDVSRRVYLERRLVMPFLCGDP